MKKMKKSIAVLSAMLVISQSCPAPVLAFTDLSAAEPVLRADAGTGGTTEKVVTQVKDTFANQLANQLVKGYMMSRGIDIESVVLQNGINYTFDPSGGGGTSNVTQDALATIIAQAIFGGNNIPSETQSVIGNVLNGLGLGGGNEVGAEIVANASTIGEIMTQADLIGQQIGLGNGGGLSTLGQAVNGVSAGPAGIVGLDTSGAGILGGALGGGTPGAGGLLGTGGRTISDNAQYSVQINGPQVIDGLVVLDPPNPLKGKAITFIATAIGKPPAGGQVIIDLPVITDSVTYDQAGYYEKQFVYPYTYIPPRVGDNQPAPIKGTMLMTTKFRVSEFNAMSTGGAGTGNYGDTGGSVGGSNISGPTLVNTGGGNSSANLLGQTPITQLTQAAPPSPGFSNALTSVLTGDIPLPFGSLTNGASSPNINIDMNGVGNGLMSVSNMVYNLLKDKDAPQNTNGVRDPAVESGNIQSDKTPDQVRKENFQDMTSILKTATQLVAAKGVTDINTLYDPDSAYTSPNEAWDMNRLTRFVNK